MRIAVPLQDGAHWFGGTAYWSAVMRCVKRHFPSVVFVGIASGDASVAVRQGLAGIVDEVVPPPRQELTFAQQVVRKVVGHDGDLARFVRSHNLDAVLSVGLNRYPGVKTVSWIPDFQHRHLPQNFSLQEIADRDEVYARSAKTADALLAMSDTVAADIRRWYPAQAEKIHVVKAAFDPAQYFIEDTEAKAVCRDFALPEQFVFVPNQWWMHKNHETVLLAARHLMLSGSPVTFVFTGLMFDRRDPLHVSRQVAQAASMGLGPHVRYCGIVDRRQLHALYSRCACVVNPSLFEGFGLSGAEGLAAGKNVVLSDIPAHREHGPNGCFYFSPQNALSCAEAISDARSAKEQPVNDYEERSKAAAEAFMKMVM